MSTHNSTTTVTRIVILGGGFAGVMAALRLAHRTRRQPVQITLVNASDSFVERTRLHQVAAGQAIPTRTLTAMLGNSGVRFVRGWVTGLRPDQRTVQLKTDQGAQGLAYDRLIYALGSFTALDRLPGAAQHALPVERHDAIHQRLAQVQAGGHVLVIGAGLTGVEIVTEIAESYPQLTVSLATQGQVGADLSAAGERYLRATLRDLRVTVHEAQPIARLEAGQAITPDGNAIPFDLCVLATGFAVSPLAANAGIDVNSNNQIVVDPYLRSRSHPSIYAVGDAATLPADAPIALRMACATALPMATHAAENLARVVQGAAEQPFRFGYPGARCISLGRHRGLLQFTDALDQPRPWVLTGRLGAWAKASILAAVMWALRLEQRYAVFQWAQTYSTLPAPVNAPIDWQRAPAQQ
jgi:NADH dehydrogenase